MSQTKPKKPDDTMQTAKDSKPKQQLPQEPAKAASGSKATPTGVAGGPKSESRPNEPPTQHLHTKGSHGKGHAFGGHSVPRGDADGDPRAL